MAGEAMISWRDTIESPHDHFRYHIHSNGTGEVGADAAGTLGFHSYVHDYVYSRGYGRDRHTLTTQQRTAVAARILLCTLYSGWFY